MHTPMTDADVKNFADDPTSWAIRHLAYEVIEARRLLRAVNVQVDARIQITDETKDDVDAYLAACE